MTKSIMIQGCGSNVGKSLLVAGLCRLAHRRGLIVRPFKPQNMSNNAAVTADGGEIGRATALQARACGIAPTSDMNPILLKPETDLGAQLIIQGQKCGRAEARDYTSLKPRLLPAVMQSFERLKIGADLVIVEGAGSPAETNLRSGDLANMGFAEAADIPVILLGDIDRGGVIAALVGTYQVLNTADAARIKGFIINKFRGRVALFDEGLADITRHTGWSSFGVLPWFEGAGRLPAEDSVSLPVSQNQGQNSGQNGAQTGYHICVPHLPRIANFDDLDPLMAEPNLRVEIIPAGMAIPVCDLILIPGSKSTLADLSYLRGQGWDVDIAAHIRRGGRVLGICGGYQMLGKRIIDADGLEGRAGEYDGLGHLDITTRMSAEKRLANVAGVAPLYENAAVSGYEIHIGQSVGGDCARPWLDFGGRAEGAMNAAGTVMGCYIHGLFASDTFRAAFLRSHGAEALNTGFEAGVNRALDDLASHIETHVDVDGVFALAK